MAKPGAGTFASDLADELLDAVAGFRRAARRVVPSPVGPFSESQVELLWLVRRQPDMSISEVATALRLAANTVSTLVAQLVDAQMLVRETDPKDRRVARLRLTSSATRRIEAARMARIAAVAASMDQLAPGRLGRVKRATLVLRELTSAMAEQAARVDS